MTATQCIQVSRCGEDDLLKFKLSIRTGKKGDLSDFEHGMVVGADGLVWVFQTLLIYWDFHTQPSLGFTENGPKKRKYPVSGSCVDENNLVDVRGQRRMCRLVRDDRKTTITQITTRYNQGMQNTISEHTTHRTLKQMDSNSSRPHRVPLLSDKNRKRRIQLPQDHQNWTIEDWKNVAWSDESDDIQM